MMIPNHHPINPDGLVLWLDYLNTGSVAATGTWKDYSGLGNDGTLVADAYVNPSGLNLDGAGDYVLLPDAVTATFGTDISYEICFNATSLTNRDYFFALGAYTTGDAGVYLRYEAVGGIRFAVRTATSADVTQHYNPGLTAGTWTTLGGTASLTQKTTYVNGVFSEATNYSMSGSFYNPAPAKSNTVGVDHIKANYYFDGAIKYLRIYNRLLSPGEFMQNYQRTLIA